MTDSFRINDIYFGMADTTKPNHSSSSGSC
jgi:hypothetical protein